MKRALFLWMTASALLGGCSGGPGGGVAAGVRDTFPRNGNTTVSTDADVLIEFSGPMKTETVKVTFDPPGIAFQPYWAGNYLTLVRGNGNGLAPNTTYRATVVGDPEVGAPVNHSFTFTTRDEPDDRIDPTFTATPVDGAVIDDPMTPVVIAFSEPMKPNSVNVSFWRGSQGKWTWNDTFERLEIAAPAGGFLPGSTVEVTVSGSDRWYNASAPERFSFSVSEPVPPLRVTGMSPPPGSTAVPRHASLALSFSRDMEPDATRAAITLTPSNGCFPGSSEWINPRMFRCKPMNGLDLGTEYTLTVGTGARDAAGNPLPEPFAATLTGGGEVEDRTAPTIVSHTPENFTPGASDDTPLVIDFSESMDRSTTEKRFRMLSNGVPHRFSWNGESTRLTVIPLSRYSPGLTVQWTVDFAEDYSGNYIYENPEAREFSVMGEARGPLLSQRDTGSVTLGSLGGGSAKLAHLLVGDDARNQSTQSFLTYDLSRLSSEGFSAVGIRQAFLSLTRVGCDGDVANLGGTLLVEAIERQEAFDLADMESPALGAPVAVPNVCAGPDWLHVDLTPAVQAAFAARETNGGLTHLRLRFPQGTNGDGLADRVVFTSQLQLFKQPELHVVYENVAVD